MLLNESLINKLVSLEHHSLLKILEAKGSQIIPVNMSTETDPNVIYGGDPEETTKIDENCPSLGEMVMSDFKLGEDKTAFVSCRSY